MSGLNPNTQCLEMVSGDSRIPSSKSWPFFEDLFVKRL
jgi:hypothetical protein